MTTGALIFAFNNEKIDYLSMARWSAKNIYRHLGIPTAIVTNQPLKVPLNTDYEYIILTDSSGSNQRYFKDVGTVTWHNTNRMDAYSLTPWDQTLVLDADYVVASNRLQTVLDIDQDFVAYKNAYDITGTADYAEVNNFGVHRMPMWWATVMMFRRSPQAQLIFDTMQLIRDNWQHYIDLHGVRRVVYRNDYALSMALGIINGHTLDHPGIPGELATLDPEHKLTQLGPDDYRVDYTVAEQRRWIRVTTDFHAMGKGQLGDIIANPA